MSQRPSLFTQGIPAISESEAAATASPARGKETVNSLLTRLRAPPFVHQWAFWHDRQDRKLADSSAESEYESRLLQLADIADVRQFWEMFNNFDVSSLKLRDSVHLFHAGIRPIWEDPRNERGGAWTFRVPRDRAHEFWKELCMMGIGEKLQEAVRSNRVSTLEQHSHSVCVC
jgi:hypothetical protein